MATDQQIPTAVPIEEEQPAVLDPKEQASRPVVDLPVRFIEVIENFSRQFFFCKEALGELKTSMGEQGQLCPILVEKHTDQRYVILAGERRWRCAVELQWEKMACIVYENLTDLDRRLLNLTENTRAEISPLEKGLAFYGMKEASGLTYSELADLVGQSRRQVTRLVRPIERLPEEAFPLLKKLSGVVADIIVNKVPEAERLDVLKIAAEKGWQKQDVLEFLRSQKEEGQGRLFTFSRNEDSVSLTIKAPERGGILEAITTVLSSFTADVKVAMKMAEPTLATMQSYLKAKEDLQRREREAAQAAEALKSLTNNAPA